LHNILLNTDANINSEKCIKTLRGHDCLVTCITNLGDDIIASGSGDETIKIWKIW